VQIVTFTLNIVYPIFSSIKTQESKRVRITFWAAARYWFS